MLKKLKIVQYISIDFKLAILFKSDQKFMTREQRFAYFLTIFNVLNFTKLNITVQNHTKIFGSKFHTNG
jgi:hypothetical protein